MLGYLRVSTGMQAGSGLGEAAQRAKIEAAAQLNDWEITGWFVDAGETGTDMDRPQFLQALEMVSEHEADGICVAKLDRVARSVRDFSALLDWFLSGGKELAIFDPAIDTSTPSGRLVANVLASVAEWEAAVIADRTSESLQAARAAGKSICRPSVADNAELVERIQSLRDSGLSLRVSQTHSTANRYRLCVERRSGECRQCRALWATSVFARHTSLQPCQRSSGDEPLPNRHQATTA
jgi:DNA invertase Pin-like site-specific DNA recombinase